MVEGTQRRSLVIVLLFLLANGCVGVSDVNRQAPPDSEQPIVAGSLAEQVHELVNRHRAAAGLEPLVWNPTLSSLAAEHSRLMASGDRPFGHDAFEERVAAARQALGVSTAAENVATNNYPESQAADRVVEGWLNSPGHRRNIDGDFQLSGVGVARTSEGVYFATQLYAAP
jgi:uncharacterized protein YkwD